MYCKTKGVAFLNQAYKLTWQVNHKSIQIGLPYMGKFTYMDSWSLK